MNGKFVRKHCKKSRIDAKTRVQAGQSASEGRAECERRAGRVQAKGGQGASEGAEREQREQSASEGRRKDG